MSLSAVSPVHPAVSTTPASPPISQSQRLRQLLAANPANEDDVTNTKRILTEVCVAPPEITDVMVAGMSRADFHCTIVQVFTIKARISAADYSAIVGLLFEIPASLKSGGVPGPEHSFMGQCASKPELHAFGTAICVQLLQIRRGLGVVVHEFVDRLIKTPAVARFHAQTYMLTSKFNRHAEIFGALDKHFPGRSGLRMMVVGCGGFPVDVCSVITSERHDEVYISPIVLEAAAHPAIDHMTVVDRNEWLCASLSNKRWQGIQLAAHLQCIMGFKEDHLAAAMEKLHRMQVECADFTSFALDSVAKPDALIMKYVFPYRPNLKTRIEFIIKASEGITDEGMVYIDPLITPDYPSEYDMGVVFEPYFKPDGSCVFGRHSLASGSHTVARKKDGSIQFIFTGGQSSPVYKLMSISETADFYAGQLGIRGGMGSEAGREFARMIAPLTPQEKQILATEIDAIHVFSSEYLKPLLAAERERAKGDRKV